MVGFRELRPMLAGAMLAMARRAKGKTAAVLHTGKANFLGARTAHSKSWQPAGLHPMVVGASDNFVADLTRHIFSTP